MICEVDGQTSPACQEDIIAGGYCEELLADPANGESPLDVTFTCNGVGDLFEIVVFDEQDISIASYEDGVPFSVTHTFVDT